MIHSQNLKMGTSDEPLRIGYVPEHFSTPLHFAKKHFGLNAELIPFPSGTGHMVTALRAKEIDISIGLTEGFVAGLGAKEVINEEQEGGYKFVGTYVDSPLCMYSCLDGISIGEDVADLEIGWAISTSPNREDLKSVDDLKSTKVGVSRIGSGSYVMSFVLADQQGWLQSASGKKCPAPFTFHPLQNFANLREGVNNGTVDFFMWEHFTSKKYYDNGEIKRIGEIYTPWPSWTIVMRDCLNARNDGRMDDMLTKLDQGVKYFEENQGEAVKYISTELDYSEEDAREWLKTVKFTKSTSGTEVEMLDKVCDLLRSAGVVDENAVGSGMIAKF